MDSVAAEIDQKNQEVFPQAETGKKPRKPRSDAGKPRGPRKLKEDKPEKKPGKKAAKKSRKKTTRNKKPSIFDHEHIASVYSGPTTGIVNDDTAKTESPWHAFWLSLVALCGHISKRTGIREAGRRLACAGRMIWSGSAYRGPESK